MFQTTPTLDESGPKLALRRGLQSLPALGVGLLFIFIGYTKFDNRPDSEWVKIFEQIGLGQWFRYLTGAVQIAGGILIVPTRTRAAGAIMLGCTMLGAAAVDAFVLGSPLVIAPMLLLILIGVVWAMSS